MDALISLLLVIGLLALAFVCAAASLVFFGWRDRLRLRYSHDRDEERSRNVEVRSGT